MRDLTRRRFLRRGAGVAGAAAALGSRAPHDALAQAGAAPTSTFAAAGLQAPGEILVDRWGIPHIYAASQPDAFFLQGWNAARDRLWQIDLWRRRGLGRLAAALGPDYVEQDRAARLFLYRGDIAQEWAAYADDAQQVATAFAGGVNAYIDLIDAGQAALPVEFGALGYRPERWNPEDVVRIRSHGLVQNVSSQVARALTLRDHGREAERLRVKLEPRWTIRVPDGLDLDAIPDDVLAVYELATQPVRFGEANAATASSATHLARAAKRSGSNNWTISGRRTNTGRPILANDPHRSQGVPSLRYMAHLEAPGLRVIGAGEPALPGISIGHNDRIAFGLTIFAIDQEDLYVYETRPGASDQYRYKGGWEPMTTITEQIPVKGQADRTVQLKFTRHGPVVAADARRRSAFAIRSVWFEPGTSAYFASIGYMRARGWGEFVKTLRQWGAPGENQVYADAKGKIGWKPGGLTPVRRGWDGLLPVPGDGRYEWDGFLDPKFLPGESDPERGFIATANAENLPRTYPYRRRKVGFEWANAFRLDRIVGVLRRERNASLAVSRQLQFDHRSHPATEIVPLLAGLDATDAQVARAIALLQDWDRSLDPGSGAAALFEVWFSLELPLPFLTAALDGDEQAAAAIWPGDQTELLALVTEPEDAEVRDRLLLQTLARAIAVTEELLGTRWSRWAWGDLHVAAFEHPISAVVDDALAKRLDVRATPVGGGNDTVGDTGYGGGAPPKGREARRAWFEVSAGASYRQVVDVGAWDDSTVVNNPGQSGDPGSPHYDDLIGRWSRGRTVPMLFSRAKVEAATERRIVVTPR